MTAYKITRLSHNGYIYQEDYYRDFYEALTYFENLIIKENGQKITEDEVFAMGDINIIQRHLPNYDYTFESIIIHEKRTDFD